MGKPNPWWVNWRAKRGRLPRARRIDELPRAREGVFRLGIAAGGGELAWDPWGADAPHILIAGTTGYGKTRLMEQMALQALDLGWDVEVLDLKGGGDYWAATHHGAVVHSTPKDCAAALKRAAGMIAARNTLMLQVPVIRERDDGRLVEDRATTMRDLPDAVRSEHEMRPRMLLIDETASIMDDKAAKAALRSGVQLGRSAGVHLVLGMQRPDADLLPGFVKHNIQARILFGPTDKEAEQMVLGSAVGGLDDIERASPRPPGRALASGVGGRPIARFHAYLLERDRYLPYFHRSPDLPGPFAPEPPASPGSPPDIAPGASPDSPDAPGPSSSSPPVDPSVPTGPPGGSSSSGRPRGLARLGRPGLVGPLARLGLRLGALRCLVGPVRSGPFVRDPSVREAVARRDGLRCRACGASGRIEVDHRRPLWAGGRDEVGNCRVLCGRCHRAATRVQTTIRAMRRRRRAMSWSGIPRPRLAWWKWAGLGLFAAGFIDGRYAMHALIVLGIVTLGPGLVRHYLVPKPFRRGKGGGLDGVSTFDAKLEQQYGGYMGSVARSYYGTRLSMVRLRFALMGAAGAYLGAALLRGWLL